MVYPESIVDMYRVMRTIEDELEEAQGRNFYDKEKVITGLKDEREEYFNGIQEEANIYAAESGADRDGGYDPDRLFDELEEQLSS